MFRARLTGAEGGEVVCNPVLSEEEAWHQVIALEVGVGAAWVTGKQLPRLVCGDHGMGAVRILRAGKARPAKAESFRSAVAGDGDSLGVEAM